MKTTGYYKNIFVNYVFTFIRNLNVTQGVWMLFLASRGLSLFQIGLLEGIFHVTSLLMETPTGAIADIFGRKTSRIVGIIMSVISSVVMILSTSFYGFALGFVFSALSYNFESGANEALVYDSLLLEGKEKNYMKIAGRVEVVFQATGIAALVIGGFIGNIEYIFVYYLSVILSVFSFFAALFFKEPQITEKNQKLKLRAAMKKQYVDSFYAIRNSSRLLYLIVFTSLLCASVTLVFFYIQLAWKDASHTVYGIGIYLAASSLAAAAGAILASKIEKRMGETLILKTAPFIVAVCIVCLFFMDFALLPFCIMNFVEAVIFVATRDYINKTITSDKRATLLSFESLMFSLVMIITFPLFGLVSDHIGMKYAFVILGALMLMLSFANLKLKSIPGSKQPD